MNRQRKPAWLVLDLGLLVILGLLVGMVRWAPPPPWRQIIQAGWIGLTYGFITFWVKANAEALERASKAPGTQDEPLNVTIYKFETPEYDMPEHVNEPSTPLDGSAAEVWKETRTHHVNLN